MKDDSFKMACNVGIATSKQFIAVYDVSDGSSDIRSLPELVKRTEINTGQKVKIIKADSGYFSKENISFLNNNQTEGFIPDPFMKSDKKKEEKEKQDNSKNKYDRENFTYDKEHDRFICPEGKFLKLKQRNKYQDGVREHKDTECKSCPCLSVCAKGVKRTFEFDFKLKDMRDGMRAKLNSDEGRQKYNERITEVEPVMADIKRNQNFPEFLCRGKKMAFIELGLASSAHNIKKIFLSLKREGIKRKEADWNSLMATRTA